MSEMEKAPPAVANGGNLERQGDKVRADLERVSTRDKDGSRTHGNSERVKEVKWRR